LKHTERGNERKDLPSIDTFSKFMRLKKLGLTCFDVQCALPSACFRRLGSQQQWSFFDLLITKQSPFVCVFPTQQIIASVNWGVRNKCEKSNNINNNLVNSVVIISSISSICIREVAIFEYLHLYLLLLGSQAGKMGVKICEIITVISKNMTFSTPKCKLVMSRSLIYVCIKKRNDSKSRTANWLEFLHFLELSTIWVSQVEWDDASCRDVLWLTLKSTVSDNV